MSKPSSSWDLKAALRTRLAHLLASYRRDFWDGMDRREKRLNLVKLISLLQIWRPYHLSELAFWMCRAMEEFHLLQAKESRRVSRIDALGLSSHWFARSCDGGVMKGY